MQEDVDPVFVVGSPKSSGSRSSHTHRSRRHSSKSRSKTAQPTTGGETKRSHSRPKEKEPAKEQEKKEKEYSSSRHSHHQQGVNFTGYTTTTTRERHHHHYTAKGYHPSATGSPNSAARQSMQFCPAHASSPTASQTVGSTFSFGSPSQAQKAGGTRTSTPSSTSSTSPPPGAVPQAPLPFAFGPSPTESDNTSLGYSAATKSEDQSPTIHNVQPASPPPNRTTAEPPTTENAPGSPTAATAGGSSPVFIFTAGSPGGQTKSPSSRARSPPSASHRNEQHSTPPREQDDDQSELKQNTEKVDTHIEIGSKQHTRARSVPTGPRKHKSSKEHSHHHSNKHYRHSGRKRFGGATNLEFKKTTPPVDKNGVVCWPKLTDEEEEAYKQKGNQLYRKAQYTEATETYTELIDRGGHRAVYYGNRAACYWVLRQLDKCLQDSLKAISMDSTFYKGHARAAKVCLIKGDLIAARKHFNNALKCQYPDAAKALSSDLADLTQAEKLDAAFKAQMADGQNVKALETAKLLTGLLQDSFPAQLQLLEVMSILQPREAQETANKLLAQGKSDNPQILFYAAKAACYTNNLQQAQQHLTMALEVDPDHVLAQQLLKNVRNFEESKRTANELFQNKKYEAAFESYSELLGMSWINDIRVLKAVVHCNRAAAGKELGKYRTAIDDCSTAIRLNPMYMKAFLRRARLHVCLEEYVPAIQDFETVLQTDPNSREAEQELKEARREFRARQDRDKTDPMAGGGGHNKYSHFHSHHHAHYFNKGTGPTPNMHTGGHKYYIPSGGRAGGGSAAPSGGLKPKKDSHYDTLGISRQATTAEIKAAFRKLALKCHPDKMQSANDKEKADAEKQFKAINEAHDILGDDQKRAEYDRKLANDALNDNMFAANYFYGGGRRSHWYY
eukprot:TRINITY_DN67583_c7_g1_i1.p1 TRINITY_DN67583_c7_g1~~TRINITY_DN67583_c7_g1_i1.p1  ORF type:complete len:1009 (-),score=144.25 TRINITY_DN67583_c7_g1_i1:125-2827(-)